MRHGHILPFILYVHSLLAGLSFVRLVRLWQIRRIPFFAYVPCDLAMYRVARQKKCFRNIDAEIFYPSKWIYSP